ncbi:MAG: hypothetical protein KBF28_05035 [Gemmatimonadales bacterium]|jgi:uncharacterized membrane protein YqiK|nr:hypothetical protein [Gemmatimonadales bacterium]
MRRWLEKRLGRQEWMLDYIDTRLIADVAVATGRVMTVPANRGTTVRRGDCRGKEGLVCRDHIRADIKVSYYIRVNHTAEDVLKVADTVGCARATDPEVLRDLFVPRFTEALKSVGAQLEFEEVCRKRDEFKDQLIEVIGRDLSGYTLDDVAISYLEQTPLQCLDPNNVFDAMGIRKITENTTRENIRTHELRQQEKIEIAKQNLYTDEAMMRFDEARAEAQARAGQAIHAGFIR